MILNKLIMCQFLYCFITLLSKNYIAIQYASLSLIIGETANQPIITGKWFSKKCNNVSNTVL